MFTQGGEVCNGCDVCEVKVEDSVTSKETKKKESNCF